MQGKRQPDRQPVPGVHVFDVAGRWYAYDLNRQDLVEVEPGLADLLADLSAGHRPDSPAARDALATARRDDGLFAGRVPRLVPRAAEPAVDRDLEHLLLTVTEDCDLRCAYCVHGADLGWVRRHSRARMPIATARTAVAYFLDRCRADRPPTVSFYGGEALLHPVLIRSVAAQVRAHPRGAHAILAVDTNGYAWDAAALDLLVTERMHVQVSLDGPAEIHDRYRRDRQGQPTHARILANLDRLLARDPAAAARLAFVATLAPPVDLFAVADFFDAVPPLAARGLPAPHVRVNFANLRGQEWPPGQQAAAGLPPVRDQVDRARDAYVAAVAAGARSTLSPVIRALFEPDLVRFHHRSRSEVGETWVPGGNCHPGRRKLHVTAAGRLQPCERTGEVLDLGDVHGGIRPAAVRQIERDFHAAVADRCAGCWALRLCGLCYAAQAEHGGAGAPVAVVPEETCVRHRRRQEDTMRLMVRLLALPAERRAWLENWVMT